MIRVTREQLMLSERGLSILANAKMPISVSFKLNKLIKQITEELKETEKVRQEILQKYGKKDGEGKQIADSKTKYIEISEENKEVFNKEIVILFSDICELDGEPISVSLLGDIKMTSAEISSIEPFLKLE